MCDEKQASLPHDIIQTEIESAPIVTGNFQLNDLHPPGLGSPKQNILEIRIKLFKTTGITWR